MPNVSAEPSIDRKHVSLRWIALLAVSILLHFVTLEWAGVNIIMPSWRDRNQTVITAQLRVAQPASKPAVAATPKPARPKPTAKPRPKAKPRSRPAPVAPPEPAIIAAEQAAPEPPAEIEVAGSSDTGIETAVELPPATEAADMADAPVSAPPEPDAAHYKVLLPPSANLKYDVEALREGQMVYGHGNINWQSDGIRYTVNGEAGILFFSLLNFASTGVIDDFGVAPVLYAEKRFRKSETNTHFQRERNLISFSASTASYPRKGGEQDRASIIWQLAGIGRGDSEKFVPGAEIDFFVAGVRDGETWRIRIIGEEEIDIDGDKVSAWHVVRIPRAGSYDQKLDIWLAPQQQWYPVKLRYTETNGDYLDMSLSNLTVAATN